MIDYNVPESERIVQVLGKKYATQLQAKRYSHSSQSI